MALVLMGSMVIGANAAEGGWQDAAGGRWTEVRPGGAGGSMRFARVLGPEAGVTFTNRLAERSVMENNNYSLGSGVALGDVDGDGLCDLYFSAIEGTNACYRNLGNWRFEDVTGRTGLGCAGWRSTGAVWADLDGDGRLDLVVSTLGRGAHAFLNLGGFRFREITAEAGLQSQTGSTGLALGDIEGDGDLDLYVANYGAQAILRGGGRAEVKRVNGEWVVTGPHAARLRMVEGNLEEVGEPDVLYRNEGNGRFTAVPWGSDMFVGHDGKPFAAPWDFGLGVQMRDINGDGATDIYVCNDFQTVDRVWLNNGRGRFRLLPPLAMRHQSYASMGVDFADLDRDGRLDFAVMEMMARKPAERLRQVTGMAAAFPVPGRYENRPEVVRNTLFWNRGDGSYAEIACFAGVEATDWSWQPVFLDADLDGFEDLFVVNGTMFDVQDRDALDRIRSLGKQTPEQSRTNLALYPRARTPNVAFQNRGDLTFQEMGSKWGFDAADISVGVALADLDGDGDQDVVVNTLNSGPLLYRNDSQEPRVAVRLRGRKPNTQGIGARVTLVGGAVPRQTQEVISGGRYLSGDEPLRVFAVGAARQPLRLEVEWRGGGRTVVPDVRANALWEVVEAAADQASAGTGADARATTQKPTPLFVPLEGGIQHRHHEESFDDYVRQPLLMKQFSTLGPGVGWIDLDGDGHDDLVIGAGRGGMPAVFRGDGRGRFLNVMPTNAAGLPDDMTGVAAVSTRDGFRFALAGLSGYERTDLGVAAVSLELAPDSALVTGAPVRGMRGLGAMVGPMAVSDYTGSGELGVFVGGRTSPGRYPLPVSSRLYREGAAGWEEDPANAEALRDVGLVSGAVWTDLNGDGFPELVVACEWGPIRVFRNERGKLVRTDPPVRGAERDLDRFEKLKGWWNSVAAADFDGDGRMDLVAGNWGLNSTYRASALRPLRFYHGDLGGRGVIDLIETIEDPDVAGRVSARSLSALAQAIPPLSAHFRTHADFSRTPIEEVFRRLEVSPAVVEAATLSSVVLLNRGEFFEWVPLPREAQFAPVFGLVAADFDGDGKADLFLAQNFHALRPEVPRMDGGRGLLLLGKGDGRFVVQPSASSGLAIDGEQRGAAASDFNEDGRVDLVVTQNGAPTRLYTNATGRPGLRVRLVGPPGNPWGFGARMRLVSAGGESRSVEWHGGSGYWSQDSSVAVMAVGADNPRRAKVEWPGGRLLQYDLPEGCQEVALVFDGRVVVLR